MEIAQLKAFVQTARHSSFSVAVQVLGVSQPNVSRHVQQLERELGLTLIDREQRPIGLTPAGCELLTCVERVLSELESTIHRLVSCNAQLDGPILIAASTIPGEFLVPRFLAGFTALHSQVRPSLVMTDSAGVVEDVLARRAEIGFLGAWLSSGRLSLIPCGEDEILLVVPAGHPFADRGVVPLSELEGQPLVERESGSGTMKSLVRLLAQQDLRLPRHQVRMVAGTSQAQLAAIEAGVGIGFVSGLALASGAHKSVKGVQIEGVTLRRTLYVAHDPGALSGVAQSFLRFVIEQPSAVAPLF